jgi:uncharacterized protein
MIRLVLDTNIWLDWLLFDDPSVAPLKALVKEGRAQIFIDAAGEAELARVLAYDLGKHSIGAEQQAACLAECSRISKKITNGADFSKLPRCPDPKDQPFLEAALAAGADYLVTKDRDLLELPRSRLPFRVVHPERLKT